MVKIPTRKVSFVNESTDATVATLSVYKIEEKIFLDIIKFFNINKPMAFVPHRFARYMFSCFILFKLFQLHVHV